MSIQRRSIIWRAGIVLMACIVTSTWANVNPFGRSITISSVIRTEQRVLGQVDVSISKDGTLTLPADDAIRLLSALLPNSVLDAIQLQSPNNQLTDKTLEQMGFPLELDTSTFELVISIPIEANRLYPISLAPVSKQRDYIEPQLLNGFINAYVSGARNEVVDKDVSNGDTYSQSHRLESGLNFGSANLFYNAEYVNSAELDGQYSRSLTQLTYDIPEQGTRISLGDVNPNTGTYQTSADMLGFSISRDFVDIPTRNVRPTATRQFSLTRTSDVDVVVDGLVVQRLTLPAGRYDLSDIPLTQGSNDINLLIRDQAGNEETISFSIAVDNNLLRQGEFEYVVSAGYPAEYRDGVRDYNDDHLLLNNIIEIGVTPSWTLTLDGQYYDDNYQIGAQSLNAWRVGITELNVSQSRHQANGVGEAVRLSYSSPDELYDEYQIRFDARYEYYSPYFSAVTEDVMDGGAGNHHYGQISFSTPIFTQYRAGLNVNYREKYERGIGSWSVGSSYSGPIVNTRARFGLNLNYSLDEEREEDIRVSATVSYPLGFEHRFVGRYQTNNNKYQLDYSYRTNTGNVGGTSINTSIVSDDNRDLNFDGGINYTANRADISVDHSSRFVDLNSDFDRVDTTSIELGTAIAFSGNKVAIGRPVGDSFAIVSAYNNLKENRISISPDNRGNSKVETVGGNNALVSDLLTYSPQLITYDVEDLPPGYDLGAGLFSVNPQYGQGYQFEIGSSAALTLMGAIFDRISDQAIALVSGRAYKLSSPENRIEFFTNRNGRFAVMGLSEGEWVLELDTQPLKKATVKLVENETMLVQKGVIYVQ